ncbi:hypothetical protein ANN_26731 [Periplaneta americana]|uniref:RNA-directed DNA polymerase from mobile element jockey n=1 Tax=Periplaneta americana TaxID=6978 RepID=A0ABQ8RZ57_PERAM|nr:hypothetical protein ANN_26731 [Periplaneta americana]
MFGLKYLSPSTVGDAFAEFNSIAPNHNQLTRFLEYVLENYVSEDDKFSPKLWASVPTDEIRTTNGAESFHRHLKRQFYNLIPLSMNLLKKDFCYSSRNNTIGNVNHCLLACQYSKNPPCINLSTNVIPWKPKDEAVKYLGVHLDRRLSWKHHINNKLKLAYSRFTKLYPLFNKKSSLKLQNCMLLYTSLLRPLLLYACPVWGGAAVSEIKYIQSFQNEVLRISLNSPWFVRNSQLHRETGIDTIKQFIHSQAKKFYNNVENVPGAIHYSLGRKFTFPTRIKSRLQMDLVL